MVEVEIVKGPWEFEAGFVSKLLVVWFHLAPWFVRKWFFVVVACLLRMVFGAHEKKSRKRTKSWKKMMMMMMMMVMMMKKKKKKKKRKKKKKKKTNMNLNLNMK